MTANKPDNIDEYIAGFPKEVQKALQLVRKTVRETAPAAVETIKYDMPTFVLDGNLAHFAAFKNHIGFYPAPTADPLFKQDMAEYKQGKGSVQFPLDKPMPLDLIRRMVQDRMAKAGR